MPGGSVLILSLGFTNTAAAAAAAAVMVAIDGGDADVKPTVMGNSQSGSS